MTNIKMNLIDIAQQFVEAEVNTPRFHDVDESDRINRAVDPLVQTWRETAGKERKKAPDDLLGTIAEDEQFLRDYTAAKFTIDELGSKDAQRSIGIAQALGVNSIEDLHALLEILPGAFKSLLIKANNNHKTRMIRYQKTKTLF